MRGYTTRNNIQAGHLMLPLRLFCSRNATIRWAAFLIFILSVLNVTKIFSPNGFLERPGNIILSSSSGVMTMDADEAESIFVVKDGKVVAQEAPKYDRLEIFINDKVFREESEVPSKEVSNMLNPFYEKECGNFIQKYADFHRRELLRLRAEQNGSRTAGKETVKTLIFTCPADENCGGWGDRLVGMSAAFAFALITNRVFLIDMPGLDLSFSSPYIDWRYDPELVMSKGTFSLLYGLQGFYEEYTTFLKKILRLDQTVDNLFYTGNRGITHLLYQKLFTGKYRKVLPPPFDDWSLNEANSFGCLINTLLQPTKRLQEYMNTKIDFPVEDLDSMIGTNIRSDTDAAFKNEDFVYPKTQEILEERVEVAEKLEDYVKKEGMIDKDKKLSLFLITDTHDLKAKASQLYSEKIRTTSVIPLHIHTESKEKEEAMLGTFTEWWLFSRCRFFMIFPNSGLGRTAAAYSLRPHSLLDIQHPEDIKLQSIDAFTKLKVDSGEHMDKSSGLRRRR